MDLELSVEFANTAIPNCWVKVDKPALADSGGHSHDGNRPMGRRFVYPINSNDTSDFLIKQTDANGKLRFRYVASQFGGVERITARLVSDTTSFDTLSLITRVPGLDSLGSGDHYVLVGAPNNWAQTNDSCRPSPPVSQHFKNHYGTQRLHQAVQQIAARYDSLYPGIRLRVNDMSIVFGGGFDTRNGWMADIVDQYPTNTKKCNDHGHCSHRQGLHADIGWTGLNQSGSCVSIDKDKLREIIEDITGNKSFVEGDHEHITVSP